MKTQERQTYVIGKLKGVSVELRRLADRIDQQIEHSEVFETDPPGTPLADLAEQVTHDILWAIPNLHLERILCRAMEPTHD